jgi:hypothetical protein
LERALKDKFQTIAFVVLFPDLDQSGTPNQGQRGIVVRTDARSKYSRSGAGRPPRHSIRGLRGQSAAAKVFVDGVPDLDHSTLVWGPVEANVAHRLTRRRQHNRSQQPRFARCVLLDLTSAQIDQVVGVCENVVRV